MLEAPVRRNLYRKYRPQRFSELLGQEHISKTIQSEFASGRISHAYMFSGPRGTGKTSAARLLAKILNCQSPIKCENGLLDCCRECSNCKRIEEMNFLDITEIDAASNNGVDAVRQMCEKVKYRPAEGKYKIYIIDEVHMLSGAAFNAFLKTLEEPPENVIFVLATTDPQKVPATIISRCQCFDFHAVSRRTIHKRLEEIVKLEAEEGSFAHFESEALSVIAECAQGGFRDALSLLDQIASSAPEETVTADDVIRLTRRLSYSTLKEAAKNVFSHNLSALIFLLNELFSLGYEPQTIAKDFLEYMRRCMLFKIDSAADKILDLPKEQAEEIKKQAAPLDLRYLINAVSSLEKTALLVKNSLQSRALLETEMIKLAMSSETPSTEALEKRILKLEETVAALKKIVLRPNISPLTTKKPPAIAYPTYPTYAKPKQEQGPFYAAEAAPVAYATVNEDAVNFRLKVSESSPVCSAFLPNAAILKQKDGTIEIKVDTPFAVNELKEAKNTKILLNSAKEIYGADIKGVAISLSGRNAANSAGDGAKIALKEEIEKIDAKTRKKIEAEPAIAEALGVFGGSIVKIEK